MTNPAIIAAAGRVLFGEQWQVPLAQLLGINERTMRRIAQAEREGADYPFAPGAFEDLAKILRERQGELSDALGLVEAALAG